MEPEPGTTTAPALTPEPAATATVEPTPTTAATPLPTSNQVPTFTPAALWRGITVAPEDRCSPYDPDLFRRQLNPRSSRHKAASTAPTRGHGSKASGRRILSTSSAPKPTTAASAPPVRLRAKFGDLLNLTLASPSVNRHEKSDNQCRVAPGPVLALTVLCKYAANTGSPSTTQRSDAETGSWPGVSQPI